MIDKKVLALSKLFYADGEQFMPSEKEQFVLSNVVDLFRRTQQSRDRNFQYFDGQNLIDYINDSVVRFNTNIDERDGIEDWQAGVHDPFTRNKVLAILGKVMEVLPIASFVGRSDDDAVKGEILTDLYHYVEDIDDYDEFMTHYLLEAIVKGTAIGYEDIEIQNKKIREVNGEGDNISVTDVNKKNTKIYASIVPLEDFYPSSVTIRKISEMPYCFWREILPYSRFITKYGGYRKSELVEQKQSFIGQENRPYYDNYIDTNTPDGSVEVIKYFDKLKDEYVIIANGIWLNPIGSEEISPLPWHHKELPFFDVKFDFFGSDFFYGKSLPDRIKSMQDVLNVLTNMLLDQSFLTIFPPLLTNGFDSIEDDYLRPGRRTPVDTQGLPISQAFQVLQNPTPSGWHQYILEYTRRVMEESSLDKVSQGVAGQGDRTTAQEIRMAASGVTSMLQLFARMINTAVKRKALLKASNILQFGLDPQSPIIRAVLGADAGSEMNNAFMVIEVKGAPMTNGKRGTKVIEFYKDKASLPTKGKVKARATLATADTGEEVQIIALPPEYIRNMRYDVIAVPNPKSEATKEIEKAIQMEKVQLYMTFFPDIVNKMELAAQTAEKFGDDPSKIFTDEALGIAPVEPQNAPGMPGMNSANMATSGGMSPQTADLAALMGTMTQ